MDAFVEQWTAERRYETALLGLFAVVACCCQASASTASFNSSCRNALARSASGSRSALAPAK